jgi:hypothetical protein
VQAILRIEQFLQSGNRNLRLIRDNQLKENQFGTVEEDQARKKLVTIKQQYPSENIAVLFNTPGNRTSYPIDGRSLAKMRKNLAAYINDRTGFKADIINTNLGGDVTFWVICDLNEGRQEMKGIEFGIKLVSIRDEYTYQTFYLFRLAGNPFAKNAIDALFELVRSPSINKAVPLLDQVHNNLEKAIQTWVDYGYDNEPDGVSGSDPQSADTEAAPNKHDNRTSPEDSEFIDPIAGP